MPALIPGYLLKKLYVKDSFKNNDKGFELTIRNSLAPGTLIGLGPLSIDGQNISLENVYIQVGATPPVRASEVSLNSPRVFPLNTGINFRVEGQTLAPGSHHLVLGVNTKEVGELKIDAEDTIS